VGCGSAGRGGTPPRHRKSPPPGRCDVPALPQRFHSTIRDMSVRCCDGRNSASEAPPEDAPGRTRTCDPLLRRREHLLRSTAACRSVCSTSDGPHIAAAVCCGLPLPPRFHVDPPAFTPSDSEVSELAAHLLFVHSSRLVMHWPDAHNHAGSRSVPEQAADHARLSSPCDRDEHLAGRSVLDGAVCGRRVFEGEAVKR
jgi:hypothetical protein